MDQIDLFSGSGADCNRVKIGGTTEILGDKDRKPEKPHTIVIFPGGSLEIARCREDEGGLYWVHVAVHETNGRSAGTIVDARIDAGDRYMLDANSAMRSEIESGGVNHIAFLVKPGDET